MQERITGVALLSGFSGLHQLPAPNRHFNVIQDMIGRGFGDDALEAEQGFVTSAGRFVDRLTARDIALAAGQITEATRPVPGLPELFSEDLW